MKSQGSRTKTFNLTLGALCTASFLCASLTTLRADPGQDNRAPDLTGAETNIAVTEGNKVSFHAYAIGVQIYQATVSPTDATKLVWTFTAPEAVLYDWEGNVVGNHFAYAGPTRPAWQTLSRSFVVGAVILPRVTVDPTAIPWLRLGAVMSSGPGVLDGTSYIQRVNTVGGVAPATAPAQLGDEARVPYTAEYFFYRAK